MATGGRYEYVTPTYDQDGEKTVDPLDPEHTAARHRGTANITFSFDIEVTE